MVRKLAGDQCQKIGRRFDVRMLNKRYLGSTDSHIDWHVFFFGEYDPIGTRLLRDIAMKTNPVFIDVGANTGTHTLAVSEHCAAVHCFEPFLEVLHSLRENLKANDCSNVSVHAVGLSDRTGQAGFTTNKSGNLGAGTFQGSEGESDLQLPIEKADDFFPEIGIETIGLVKIDVEGHELAVFRGMSGYLKNSRPIVLWEFNPEKHGDQKTADLESLFPSEYKIFRLGYQERWTRSTPQLQPVKSLKRGNLVALPVEKLSLVKHLMSNDA